MREDGGAASRPWLLSRQLLICGLMNQDFVAQTREKDLAIPAHSDDPDRAD
jgi:hypothetical protein